MTLLEDSSAEKHKFEAFLTERGINTFENLSRDPSNADEYLKYIDKKCQLNDIERSYLQLKRVIELDLRKLKIAGRWLLSGNLQWLCYNPL